MKRLTFLFLFICSIASGQQIGPKYSAGISLLPDYGMGVIAHKYMGHVGIYAGYSHSILDFSYRNTPAQKISIGGEYICYQKKTRFPFIVSVGVSYNTYTEPNDLNYQSIMPLDLQIGWGCMIKRINWGFRYDVFKKDASMDLTVNFGRRILKYNYKRR